MFDRMLAQLFALQGSAPSAAQTAGKAHNFHGFSTPRGITSALYQDPKCPSCKRLRNERRVGRGVATLLLREALIKKLGAIEETGDEN